MEVPEGHTPFVYEGPALRALAFPLGGIGTGHFCICGDGGFRQWQIFNQVNHLAYLPGTFLAISTCRRGQEPKAMLLQSSALYSDEGFSPAPLVSDHIVPAEAKRLMETLPGVARIRFTGQYPIARLEYKDPDLPVDVELSAFSPFVPLDQKNSGLPLAFLVLRLRNPSREDVSVSAMASLQNAVGWDGVTPVSGTSCPLYGGNRNTPVSRRGATILLMGNDLVDKRSPRSGEMALALLAEDAWMRPHWEDPGELWADFVSDGRLTSGPSFSSELGRTWNGALGRCLRLKPGESQETVFAIAWYFPNRYVNWDQKGLGVNDDKTMFWLGNMYANWYRGVLDVLDYAIEHYDDLRAKTELFRDCLFGTTLPPAVLDAVSSQISTIRSPTCFWTEDGMFYGFEGCCGASTGSSWAVGGCCPLNCTHVWNYEQALSVLFPELERKMREADLVWQMGADGRIPHRTVLPLYLPRWHDEDRTSHVYAADGHCGTILKTYREYRRCGDAGLLDKHWPALVKALDYAIATWDPDMDGMFDGPQWNTYDCHLQGHNSFVSGLYLAALRAMEEMSKIRRQNSLAKKCRAIFAKGSSLIDSELWNGEYFVQRYDEQKHKSMQYGSGCHSDQLLGQWWAHVLDLGYILPKEHVRRALESICKHNLRQRLGTHLQRPRVYLKSEEGGLLICTWPKGGRPDPVTLYCDEVWTGIEYSVAGLMFYEGMIEEGMRIVGLARKRHDGTLRNPWNEVECGDHYVRPLSSWTMLEALSGYVYDASKGVLGFRPRLNQESFRCLFVGAKGWGTYTQELDGNRQVCQIELKFGDLSLKEIRIPRLLKGPSSVKVFLGGNAVEGAWIASNRKQIVVKADIKLSGGQSLSIVSEAF